MLDDLPQGNWVLPGWAAGDPLDGLFGVWFGAHGSSAQGISLRGQFAARAATARIDEGAEVPAGVASWVTPIAATGAAIDYKGISPVPPLWWSIRPTRQALQRCGTPVPAALPPSPVPIAPRVYIWCAAEPAELPAALVELLAARDVTPMPVSPESGQDLPHGWHGDHPFTTRYAQGFSRSLEADGRVTQILVPAVGSRPRDSSAPHGMSSRCRWRSQPPPASGLTGHSPSPTSGHTPACSAPTTGSCLTSSARWMAGVHCPRSPVLSARELKHRAKEETRTVPIHPELVKLLRDHLAEFGTGPDGRVFTLSTGKIVTDRAYLKVFHEARQAAFTETEVASLIARRPYDLRHAAVST